MELHILAALRPSPAHVVQAGIPTEPQALFVYVLVAVALVWVWLGSRRSGGTIESASPPEQDAQDRDVSGPPVSPTHRKRKKKRPITWVQ